MDLPKKQHSETDPTKSFLLVPRNQVRSPETKANPTRASRSALEASLEVSLLFVCRWVLGNPGPSAGYFWDRRSAASFTPSVTPSSSSWSPRPQNCLSVWSGPAAPEDTHPATSGLAGVPERSPHSGHSPGTAPAVAPAVRTAGISAVASLTIEFAGLPLGPLVSPPPFPAGLRGLPALALSESVALSPLWPAQCEIVA